MDFHFFLVILFFFKCPTTFPFCFPNVPLRLGFNVFSISYFYLSTISAFCQQLFYFFLFICILCILYFFLSIRDADKISIYYILYVCLTLHIALFIKKKRCVFQTHLFCPVFSSFLPSHLRNRISNLHKLQPFHTRPL